MYSNFAFLDIGASELVIILVIILLLFGSRKLPELSKSLGEATRELRKGLGTDESGQDEQKSRSPKSITKSKKDRKSK